ncbi:serine/threonine-protein kinase 4 homolog A-like [Paramacrobiotus metropolitanus]|uniref:serine/threonine-protein kinase 4 homolog A-like n=1 Tax=Paramacrobiotus metropolitanus TaxID=2943436 RepID=UPI0024459C1F|nr:serine/threonine-protein kinase 4 homolog A-like [Paramacrobiotus metropolitanus]
MSVKTVQKTEKNDDETCEEMINRFGIAEYRPPFQHKLDTLLGVSGGSRGVFLTEDSNSGQHYAVKCIELEKTSNHTELHRYVQDFKCILELTKNSQHNLVKYFFVDIAYFENIPEIRIFMEYCPGGTLREKIQTHVSMQQRYSQLHIQADFTAVLNGVRYLHQRHVAHRDLNGSSILFTVDGTPKIASFGLLVQLDPSAIGDDEVRRGVGTISYMAPEAFNATFGQVGLACDIWALGCVLLEMLQGHSPRFYRKETNGELVLRIRPAEVQQALAKGEKPFYRPELDRDDCGDDRQFLDAAKNFLDLCFQAVANKRPAVEELIKHPMLRICSPISLTPEIQNNNVPISESDYDTETNCDNQSESNPHKSFGCSCSCEYQPRTDGIGKGAFGTVYKALITDRGNFSGTGNIVAIKEIFMRQSMLAMLQEKNTSTAKWKQLLLLKHANVIRYHKISFFKTDRGTTVELVMDYIQDGDLAHLIANLDAAPKQVYLVTVVNFARQISTGLAYLHSNKFIHGDLKPANILMRLKPNGHKLLIGDLDDGIVMMSNRTCTKDITHMRGTARYMSPEMVKTFLAGQDGEKIGRKTDVWSLGCIIIDLVDYSAGILEKWLWRKGTTEELQITLASDLLILTKIADGFVPLLKRPTDPGVTRLIEEALCDNSQSRISSQQITEKLEEIYAAMSKDSIFTP